MSFYSRRILPWLITQACTVKPIARQRDKIVPLARGEVLEIGAGGGLNLRHYDRGAVARVRGLDISPELLRKAEAEAARLGVPFEPVLLDAATIPLEPASIDTVLVTYTLCSIDALSAALSEMRRVLKPGGQLIFCEHGAAPDHGVARVQRMVEPLWKPLAGGCHLTRDPVAELGRAGFAIEWQDQMYLPKTWRPVGWNVWGIAHPDRAQG